MEMELLTWLVNSQVMVSALEQIEGFTLFLLLHMGRVDGSLHPNERDTILEKMKELFPENSSYEQTLTVMELQYSQLKYGGAEAILKEGFRKFSQIDPLKRKEIYTALFDIINANGRVNEEETQTLQIFKSWLLF